MKKILIFALMISQTWAGVSIPEDWIKEKIRPTLQPHISWGDYDISFMGTVNLLTVDGESINDLDCKIIRSNYNSSNQVFSILMDITNLQNKVLSRLQLRGQAIAMVEVPVLLRQIGPGETIKPTDVTHIRMAAAKVNMGTIRDSINLIGHQPRYRLMQPGKPVFDRDVMLPIMVVKGNLTTVVYKSGPMTLTARAIAQQNGVQGETIQLLRPDAKTQPGKKAQIIFAKVIAEGVAEVIPVSQTY